MAPTAAYMDYSTAASSTASAGHYHYHHHPAAAAAAPPGGEEPISRTYQYRKVMKPMLERKRRARINRCLDELKELMVSALHNDGENVSKLEKADILELTVRHLHTLKRQHQLVLPSGAAAGDAGYADRFRAGFNHCAQEVTQFLTGNAAADHHAAPLSPVAHTSAGAGEAAVAASGQRLLQHLGACVQQMDVVTAPTQTQPCYESESEESPRRSLHTAASDSAASMWRPW